MTTPLHASAPPAGASSRAALVNQARERWHRDLVDLSRRNNLLYFRETQATLNLSEHDPKQMEQLLAGRPVSVERLLKDQSTGLTARLRKIQKQAVANQEEKGLETLFLALGMATWQASDGGRAPEAAVLLVPVDLATRGRENPSFSLQRRGDIQLNPTLLHVLAEEHGCTLDAEELLANVGGEGEQFDPQPLFERLHEAAGRVTGFAVQPRAHLGNFAYQKMALVQDLTRHGELMVNHDLIAALAGDAEARTAIRRTLHDIDPRQLERVPPEQEYLIRDADASQQRVIAAVLAGQHGVIQGPPGTGKSQTIANLIAALTGAGKSVLFVAEKRAALEVVYRRLDQAGLGHLALDLHGADLSRRAIVRRLGENLASVRATLPVAADSVHRPFVERRVRLNAHAEHLHRPRDPSGLSIYELQGRLLRLPEAVRTATRWRGLELRRLDATNAAAVRDLLTEASGLADLVLRRAETPWLRVVLPDAGAVRQLRERVARVSGALLPALREALRALTEETGLRAPTTLLEAQALVTLVAEVNATLADYPASLYQEDLAELEAALATGQSVFAGAIAWWSNRRYRRARQQAQQLRQGKLAAPRHYQEMRAAHSQRTRWRVLSQAQALPVAYPRAEQAAGALRELLADIGALEHSLQRSDLPALTLDALEDLLAAFNGDQVTPFRLVRVLELEAELDQRGARTILTTIRQSAAVPALWPTLFDHAWLASCLDDARTAEPTLAGFKGETHSTFVAEFADLDRQRLDLAAGRVRRAHAERVIATLNQFPAQAALLRRETQKSRRHLPLRSLLAEAPDVLVALCPCWMASPLSVSQLLGAERRYFDVVLFDEASQVLPQDAIAAILRASQVVVAGDRHQLPPTAFFALGDSSTDEEDDPTPTAGFESLLDLLSAFLTPWSLEWHYRSRDEALIAFSNRHIYSDGLVTFPGARGGTALTHILVPHGAVDGQEESASEEVRRVVELVLEHAQMRPHETLGVITMGIKHATRVEAALERALASRADLDDFFDTKHDERFFVKNLERVQGDERDAIILSIGYGKDRAGRLPYRFGPLLQEGGERRLNVAVTRARQRMTVVSSFGYQDMDPARSSARGVELLRLYLQYAATQGAQLGDSGAAAVPMNPFEEAVYHALRAEGLALIPQWGVSRYRIDFAVSHPEQPGRFVLAIECDGASYHALPTARDRDRLRQEHLEALGWRFHRIWSTDWFMEPAKEIRRAVAAYQAALTHWNSVEGTGAPHPAPAPVRELAQATVTPPPLERGPRPRVAQRQNIQQYDATELRQLLQWIRSDGRLRTNDELIDAMIAELGFKRRGTRLVAVLQEVIRQAG